MKRAHDDVKAFHELVGATVGDVAKPDATVDMELRLKLMAEEFDELLAALCPSLGDDSFVRDAVTEWMSATAMYRRRGNSHDRPDLAEVADALADLEYVTVGSAVTWGIPGGEVWSEVHDANMRKGGGPKDPRTGKALKPPGWRPPDVAGVLRQMAEDVAKCRPVDASTHRATCALSDCKAADCPEHGWLRCTCQGFYMPPGCPVHHGRR